MLLKIILYPFSILYDLITTWRNKLYDSGQKKSIAFEMPVVNVGNLTVGGTGKTPHVIMLVEIFSKIFNANVAVLSRGYGRKTKGFKIAQQGNTSSEEMGDEPLQIYRTFNCEVPVAVCEERIIGIPFLLQDYPETDLIILDDAYQHRKVKPIFNILLCDYYRPFYNDFLLPAGRLRESRKGAQRADMVIVTKSPDSLDTKEKGTIIAEIKKYSKAPIFFSRYTYQKPTLFAGEVIEFVKQVILVTGIANTKYLLSHIQKKYDLLKHFEYADHVKYTEKHISQIRTYFEGLSQKNTIVLTTEKDMVKLIELLPKNERMPFYYLPITCEIMDNETEFIDQLKMATNK